MAGLFERAGADFFANTTTSGTQGNGKVAALAGGGFVVVWQDNSGTGGDPDTGIKAQRFDAAGNKLGSEFLINAGTAGNQLGASVTGLSGGRFVVTWSDLGTSGTDTDGSVKARVFAADGTPLGSEFLVNTATTGSQAGASISALTGGGFVIAWQDPSGVGGDASSLGIKAQLFDANGAKVGGESLVNTTTSGAQFVPQVAAVAGGGFAVSWTSSPGGSMVQLFNAAGAKVGGEQGLVVGTPFQATGPRVDALASGFLATWSELAYNGDPLGYQIKGQRFDASGVKVGSAFAINSPMAGNEVPADVRALPGGGFIAVWNAYPDGTTSDVFAQVFDASGQKVGSEFVINSQTAGNQAASAIELLASGDLAVVWMDGTSPATDVKVQLLAPTAAGATDIAISTGSVSETAVENLQVAKLSALGGALNATYTFEIVSDSASGAFGVDGDKLIVVDNDQLDFETAPMVQVQVRAIDNDGHAFEKTITLTIADAAIEQRYSAGPVFSAQGFDEFYDTVSSVTPLAGGGFLVARYVITSGLALGARGQIFDADGDAVGGDFAFNLPLGNNYEFPIAALSDGGFVAAFGAAADGGLSTPVKVQRFDAAGNEVGGEAILDGGEGGTPEPTITSLANGGFVVTWLKWATPLGSPVTSDVHGQLFNAAGAKVGSEFVVNTGLDHTQYGTRTVASPDGGFAVVWREYDPAVSDENGSIEGQLFDAAGVKSGGELTILADATGAESGLGLAALASGGFAVVWAERVDDDNDIYALAVQILDAHGAKVGGPMLSYVGGINPDRDPAVAALPDGGFVINWTGGDGTVADGPEFIWGQFFDASGALVGDRFVVDDSPLGDEESPKVGVTTSGDVVFAWSLLFQRDSDNAYTNDAYARIVHPLGTAGTPANDRFELDQPGDVTVNGLGGDDAFYFGAAFTAADRVDGGAGSNDQIGLEGNYTGANALTLGANTISNVEVIAVLPGFDYAITAVDANVPAGGTLKVFGGNLGAGDNLTFNGSAESDGKFMVYGGLGTDLITTGAGDDGIYFGPGKFDPAVDRVNGGAGSNDQLALDGDYTLTLDGTAIQNIEVVALLPGVAGNLADYNLTLANSLIGAGKTMTVWGSQLQTALTVNGSAETDGSIKIYGGSAGDTLTGGAGADWFWGGLGGDAMTGGPGADRFSYTAVAESAGAAFDRLVGFNDTADTIDLPFAVTGFAAPASGALNAASMSAGLQGAFAGLGTHQAAVFTATSGDMSGRAFLLVDANGVTGYQSGADFLIELVSPASPVDQVAMFV